MGFFDGFFKKNVSCEIAGKQLMSVVMNSSQVLLEKVVPDVAKMLNVDLDSYDKNMLARETMFVCLWAATKALEFDNNKLTENLHNSFFDLFDKKAGEVRALFNDRHNRYNAAWNESSSGMQFILAVNIFSEIFNGGKLDKELIDAFAMHMVQMFILNVMTNVLEVRKHIKLTNG